MYCKQGEWREPLEVLGALQSEKQLVCLYSGSSEAHTGRYSFIAWEMTSQIQSKTWDALSEALKSDSLWHENLWFGWLGYGLRHAQETLSEGENSRITHANLCFMQFAHILRFDHKTKVVEYYYDSKASDIWKHTHIPHPNSLNVKLLTSNMSKESYLASIRATVEKIQAGDFYQANITRKFMGEFSVKPNPISTFHALCTLSPAPYSALIIDGDDAIISSSPECFLTIHANGKIIARPIKGSARRSEDETKDSIIRNQLAESEKDHAENRMIVDLMRNDLSRVSLAGTVKVTAPATLHSYATIHHLIPTIMAEKETSITTLESVAACFPPGSMTGAPKIAAMQWCTEQEKQERDIYSGAIGWFGGDGSCDLSVVIRTLIIRNTEFEFQVGGGIVADSVPELEWQETLAKARAIATLLGISQTQLEAL